MNVLAVIPARGGSKGVPRKNIRKVGGHPLIAWSIWAGRASSSISRLVVSTEDEEIGRIAAQYGAEVIDQPGASDTSRTDDALLYAVRHSEMSSGAVPDLVVLLQATVPVRAPGLVDACIERLIATGADALFTAYPLHFVWHRWDARARWMSTQRRVPRQRMPLCDHYWHEDGSVYVVRTPVLLETKNRLGGHNAKLEMFETERSVDIDTEADLVVAAAMLASRELVEASA